MIQLMVREMMVQKGIKPSIHQLQKSGIGLVAAKKYLHTTAKTIKLEDLYKLCLYFNCTPKELLRVVVDFDISLFQNSPLLDWTASPKVFPIQTMRNFSPEQMQRLQEAVEEIVGDVEQ